MHIGLERLSAVGLVCRFELHIFTFAHSVVCVLFEVQGLVEVDPKKLVGGCRDDGVVFEVKWRLRDGSLFFWTVGVRFTFAREVEEGEFVNFEVGVVGFGPVRGAVLSCHHATKFFIIFLVCLSRNEKHGVVYESRFEFVGVT